jgi:hypothetical protein
VDQRGVDSSRGDSLRGGSSPEARASALRNYRRAMGLCYKWGEKWSRDHSCAAPVQLHVVQELWELFQLEDESSASPPDSVDSADQLFLAISKAAINGVDAPRTVKFLGSIQDHLVSVLVGSGSSSSFLSATLAAKLFGVQPLHRPLSV